MNVLLYLIIAVHVVVCLFLIGVVLLQQGQSADMGVFGGQGSQTAFGPRAAANLMTRFTAWAAAIFMITSLSLTILYLRSTGSGHSVFSGMKDTAPVSGPAKSGK